MAQQLRETGGRSGGCWPRPGRASSRATRTTLTRCGASSGRTPRRSQGHSGEADGVRHAGEDPGGRGAVHHGLRGLPATRAGPGPGDPGAGGSVIVGQLDIHGAASLAILGVGRELGGARGHCALRVAMPGSSPRVDVAEQASDRTRRATPWGLEARLRRSSRSMPIELMRSQYGSIDPRRPGGHSRAS